ncbi:MAG: 16S rRNA (cytosine(967)-C(5))-methyltransferase RsmB [Thermoleophilaceae bacterium]|nr:16S rRNA (cytosine(967)-C(5))-methyltransferase RsmB [Thermoleophilaceae bacterium]
MTPSGAARRPRPRSGATPARRCALRVLRRVFAEGAFADRALRAEADRARLEGRDRALAERIAFGAVQRRATLDHVLAACSARPLAAIDPQLLDALRIGVLQLLFLDAVPDRAAVEQTVELAREVAGERTTGFANAVMRRAAREGPGLLGGLDDATPEGAAVRHSHPEWIARLWWDVLGPAGARALLAHDNEPPELAVRVNELVATRGEVLAALRRGGASARPDAALPEALAVDGPFDLPRSPLFAAGAITPQARASMLVARVVAPRAGERVLDLCAAPGTKTSHLAALMGGRGTLAAVELHPGRAGALAENCRRLRAELVEIVSGDARHVDVGEGYDRILLDPPCSDLGTLAARPDARWRKSPADVHELAELGRELLVAAARRVRPGGTVTFSTCTISPPENAEQIEGFLATRSDFAADDLGAEWPDLRDRSWPRYLQTLPHRHETAGFFIARLRRTGWTAPPS